MFKASPKSECDRIIDTFTLCDLPLIIGYMDTKHITPQKRFEQIMHIIDRSFDAGNKENFILNEILLVISIFLMYIVGLSIMASAQMIIISQDTWKLIHQIEFFFGCLFLIEFILRTIYVYIPDKKFTDPYTWVAAIVIASLLLPQFFNVAFLRLIWIVKMFKIYHMRRESHIMIAKNPDIALQKKIQSEHSN